MVMVDVAEPVGTSDGLCTSCQQPTTRQGLCINCLTDQAASLLRPLDQEAQTGLQMAAHEVTKELGETIWFDAYQRVLHELQVRSRRTRSSGSIIKTSGVLEERVGEELDRLRIRDQAWRRFQTEQHPPAVLPEIRTLRERLADPAPDVEWRVEGWQPAGTRVMLAAQFKAGKTTLTGNLARCLVDGDWWLDQAPVTTVNGGTVSIVDFEMSERQIDGWLADQKILHDDQVLIIPLRGVGTSFNIIDEATRTRWAQQLTGTEYLILDCLRPILDALGLDEHKDGGRFLTAFDALCAEAGIKDSLIVHHMGHTGERSRGDSRFRDWPDVEWRLVRETDEPAGPRYISAYGRDVDINESQLSYDPLTRHLRVIGGNRSNAAARRALDDILTLLEKSDEPISKRELAQLIAAETEHTQKAARAAVAIGIHSGEIHLEIVKTKHLLTLSALTRQSASQRADAEAKERVSAYMDNAQRAPSDGLFPEAERVAPEEDPW